MQTNRVQPNFGRLRLGKITSIGHVNLPSESIMEKLSENADVFIKSCEHTFTYKGGKIKRMGCSALKISARPLNLGFWAKLFDKRTVTEYYPVGNMKDSVIFDKTKTIEDVIREVVSKVV